MTAKRFGYFCAAARQTSLRSPSHDGGTSTQASTPAASISRSRSCAVIGSGLCGWCRAGHGRSGVFAAQIWTWESTIISTPATRTPPAP